MMNDIYHKFDQLTDEEKRLVLNEVDRLNLINELRKETLRLLEQLSVEERRLVLREYAEKYGWAI